MEASSIYDLINSLNMQVPPPPPHPLPQEAQSQLPLFSTPPPSPPPPPSVLPKLDLQGGAGYGAGNYQDLMHAAQRLKFRESKDVIIDQLESQLSAQINKHNNEGQDTTAMVTLYQLFSLLRVEHLFLKECSLVILLGVLDMKEHESMLKRRRLEDSRRKPKIPAVEPPQPPPRLPSPPPPSAKKSPSKRIKREHTKKIKQEKL